jgi:hypothetical protein
MNDVTYYDPFEAKGRQDGKQRNERQRKIQCAISFRAKVADYPDTDKKSDAHAQNLIDKQPAYIAYDALELVLPIQPALYNGWQQL